MLFPFLSLKTFPIIPSQSILWVQDLTTLFQRPVKLDVIELGAAVAKQASPVDGMVIAELGVLTEVHTPVTDLPKRAQAQRGEGRNLHYHQRETPLEERRRTT